VVKTLYARHIFELDVPEDATVAELKALIAKQHEGYAVGLQRLALSRRLLEDARTLASYDVWDGACVLLLLRMAAQLPAPLHGVHVCVHVAGAPHTSATLLRGEEAPAARAGIELHDPFRKVRGQAPGRQRAALA
jgi:hypothetical protein